MEQLRGIASHVKHSIDVSGTHNSVITTHVTDFEILGKPVSYAGAVSAIINDGDEIDVTGYRRSGIFEAYAYRNLTKGVTGNLGYLGQFIFSVIFLLFGLMAIVNFSQTTETVIGALFIGISLLLIRRGIRMWKAVRMLTSR